MILVLSTGRSGTRSLARWFARSSRLHAVHEAEPLCMDEVVDYTRGALSRAELARILASTRRPVVDGRAYAESNHILSYAIPAVEEAFPGVRYVWLIRDGRDVVASLMARRAFEAQPVEDVRGDWLMRRFGLHWFGDLTPGAWHALSPFEKTCWYWEKTNGVLEAQLRALPRDRWLPVRLEDPVALRDALVRRLGLDDLRDVPIPVANQSKRGLDHWSSWSEGERRTFARICGPRMDEVYPSWQDARGTWRDSFQPPRRLALQLAVQRALRSVVFGENAGSRLLLSSTRHLPATLRIEGKQWLGIT